MLSVRPNLKTNGMVQKRIEEFEKNIIFKTSVGWNNELETNSASDG